MTVKTVLIDLSGTLHIEDIAIPGAAAALELLRKHVNVRFVTNTSKESRDRLHTRVTNCGFKIDKSEMFTTLSVARDLILEKKYRPFFIIDKAAMDEFEGIETTNPNAVVMGLAPSMYNDETMNKAFRLIKEKNAALIALNKGRYHQKNDGLHMGPGPYVVGLEYATGTKAHLIGKPSVSFYHAAAGGSEEAKSSVMIGDDVEDDVIGAMKAGMRSILVKTGKYREGDELKIDADKRNVVPSFVEAVDLIIKERVL